VAEQYQTLVIEIVSPLLDPGTDLTSTTPLSALLDSMAMVQIILALEGRLGCSFGPSDMQFDHFETVETLAQQLSSIRLPQ
jgi:acyl carrier protein